MLCDVVSEAAVKHAGPLHGSGMEGRGSVDMAQASQQLDGENASRDHDGWLTLLSHFPG